MSAIVLGFTDSMCVERKIIMANGEIDREILSHNRQESWKKGKDWV